MSKGHNVDQAGLSFKTGDSLLVSLQVTTSMTSGLKLMRSCF